MAQTTEEQLFVNRALTIANSPMGIVAKMEAFRKLHDAIRENTKIETMDQNIDEINVQNFEKLRMAGGL
jgi:hypothetical protein